eukprot:Lankesteria_metandrocarpae@DN5355_c0_g1_i7.p1
MKDGYRVFQAHDKKTCEPLNRYLYHYKNAQNEPKWTLDSDLDGVEHGFTIGDLQTTFEICPNETDVYFRNGELHSKLVKAQSSICFPTGAVEVLPVDSGSLCVMRVTGSEEYTFLPTMKKSADGNPVFQGYDDKCQPLNRYLHHFTNPGGNPEWAYDDDLEVTTTQKRLGYIKPQFTVCPAHTTVYRNDDLELAKIASVESSICFTNKADALPSVSDACVLRITGRENFLFYPTTTVKNGMPVYQGRNNACDGLSRYLAYQMINAVAEWLYVDDLASMNILGMIDYDGDCPLNGTVNFVDGATSSKLTAPSAADKALAAGCIPPTKAVGLELDFRGLCIMRVTGSEEYTFLPTMEKSADGNPVFQGYDDKCQPLNRYLHHFTNPGGNPEWAYDDDLEVTTTQKRLGYIKPQFTVCPARTTVYGNDDNLELAKLASVKSSVCLDALPMDTTYTGCLYEATGYEEYTFLPTLTRYNGHRVFQAYDDKCVALGRYLRVSGNTWFVDYKFEGGGHMGYSKGSILECRENYELYFYNHTNPPSALTKIQSHTCFPTTTATETTTAATTAILTTTTATETTTAATTAILTTTTATETTTGATTAAT